MQQEPIIQTKNLTKLYGAITAVKDVNIEIFRGEVYGFLGPNGAGKTTTIGMMLGLITPTSGGIELFGTSLHSNVDVLHRVGAIVETSAFYPYLSGHDNLRALAEISGVRKSRIAEVLDVVGMTQRAHHKYKTYSLGMKQRLGIAAALLGDPELILLDEPTNGLDPAGMKEVRELIVQLARIGKTIFLSSHLLYEVEQVCTRVAIIKKGAVIAQGVVDDLLKRGRRLQLKIQYPDKAAEVLRTADWIKGVTVRDDMISIETSEENAARVAELLASNGLYPSELKALDSSLDFFLEITKGETRV
jgi:ABC-2 type transport system ATP-binding protein